MTADLTRLLKPRSICAIGGREAARVVEQCRRMGFAGPVYPVHPARAEMAGVPCYRSVADLPEAPDAAFVGVRRDRTIDAVRALAARGAGGAVCYASGFRESGEEGAALQAALVSAAGDMPILGPNCYGFVNYLDGAPLWPDQHGGRRRDRGVAIVSQSSNLAITLTMNLRAAPIAAVVTLGNRAVLGASQVLDALLEDPRITAIGLLAETLDDAPALAAAAARARARRVPVVALKLGRSEAGARLTVSHTASLAGSEPGADAFFRRTGIGRVHSIPALLEALKLLHAAGPLGGRDVASLSCSGGEAALMADTLDRRRLRARPLARAERERVAATLNDLVTVSNPLDYHTFIWGDAERLTDTFAAMLGCGFDLGLLVIDPPRRDRCEDRDWRITLDAWEAALRRTGARGCVLSALPESLPESLSEDLISRGIAPLAGVEEGLAAVEAAADVGEAWARPEPPRTTLAARADEPRSTAPSGGPETETAPGSRVGAAGHGAGPEPERAVHGPEEERAAEAPHPSFLGPRPLADGREVVLTEWEVKRRLARAGIPVPCGALVGGPEEAVRAAARLGAPVVVKAVGRGLAHKSEQGAVRLGLRGPSAVRDAARALRPLGDGLLVERMVEDGVAEVIAGVARDPHLGLILLVGSGGVLAELAGDRAVLLAPAPRSEIEAALATLKVARLIDGFRGRPRGDRAALVDALIAIQQFALDHADRLIELDVNPIVVRPAGRGVAAVDALLRAVVAEGDEEGPEPGETPA